MLHGSLPRPCCSPRAVPGAWAGLRQYRRPRPNPPSAKASRPCRRHLDELTQELNTFSQQHVGQEVLLLAVGHITALVESRLATGALSAAAPAPAPSATPPAQDAHTLMRTVVWCAPAAAAYTGRGEPLVGMQWRGGAGAVTAWRVQVPPHQVAEEATQHGHVVVRPCGWRHVQGGLPRRARAGGRSGGRR